MEDEENEIQDLMSLRISYSRLFTPSTKDKKTRIIVRIQGLGRKGKITKWECKEMCTGIMPMDSSNNIVSLGILIHNG